MEYVALAQHSPQECPGSNAKVRKSTEQAMGRLEELGKKHQVQMKSAHVLAPRHLTVFVFEAPRVEAVRDFLEEAGLAQWNDIQLHPSMSMQEAMQTASLPSIW